MSHRQIFKIQVKATKQIDIRNGYVYFRIEKNYLRKYIDFDIPVILVIADLINEEAYYLYIQEWIEQNKELYSLFDDEIASVEIKIPITRKLEHGLDARLKDISRLKTLFQSYTQLKRTLSILRELGINDSSISNKISKSEFIDKISEEIKSMDRDYLPIDQILTNAINLGCKLRATDEGNIASQALFGLCQEYGCFFSTEDIIKLVKRDDTISITGLTALGLLYDTFPSYLIEIKVAEEFKKENMDKVYYYCKLREKYIGIHEIDIALGIKKLDYDIEGYTLDDYFIKEVPYKYPNKGTYFFLMCTKKTNYK